MVPDVEVKGFTMLCKIIKMPITDVLCLFELAESSYTGRH